MYGIIVGELTFLSTLEDTFTRGIGCSVSPMSVDRRKRGLQETVAELIRRLIHEYAVAAKESKSKQAGGHPSNLTFEHLLDEHRTLGDIAINRELLVVRSGEADHVCSWQVCGCKCVVEWE